MLKFSVLGSGSGGNSAVVCHEDGTTILIDAGLSARQLVLRLESLEIDPDSLTAILLTHEHGDHTCGLDVFLRKRPDIPVFVTAHTCEVVRREMKSTPRWQKFTAGTEFSINDLTIETFSVPHDAVDPVGFVVRATSASLGILSDVGHVTTLIRDRLKGVDSLFVEANYDDVMLQNDIKRPWATKQRISSRHGHLSNDQTKELVTEIALNNSVEGKTLQHIVLGHLSSDCNSPEVACRAISEALQQHHIQESKVTAALQRNPLPLMSVTPDHRSKSKSVKYHSPTSAESRVCEDAGQVVQAEWAF